MIRSTWIVTMALLGAAAPLRAQAPRTTGRQPAVHYGKWLTAGATVVFTVLAAREHSSSSHDWDALLTICRSAQDACTLGPDGRYLRSDAELLYQSSRMFDRRANRRLLGAQASLLVTAALFILDLHPGREGPDNIPFAPLRVTVEPTQDGVAVGMRIAF
ncbi:MAG TPA: hypothetical protein VN908_03620 [Gemmatimonadales bacterium]|nr:hypothetical protein [Gemmatimonadales bacterium]